MNEKTVLKRSVHVFFIASLIILIMSLCLQDISYIFGFILGYIINIIIFLMNIMMSEGILKFSMSTAIIVIMFILKLLFYALGFFIAVKMDFIHIFGVFLGYLVIKITIYIEGFIHKGGEINEN